MVNLESFQFIVRLLADKSKLFTKTFKLNLLGFQRKRVFFVLFCCKTFNAHAFYKLFILPV